jgi:hypothetical protein
MAIVVVQYVLVHVFLLQQKSNHERFSCAYVKHDEHEKFKLNIKDRL